MSRCPVQDRADAPRVDVFEKPAKSAADETGDSTSGRGDEREEDQGARIESFVLDAVKPRVVRMTHEASRKIFTAAAMSGI